MHYTHINKQPENKKDLGKFWNSAGFNTRGTQTSEVDYEVINYFCRKCHNELLAVQKQSHEYFFTDDNNPEFVNSLNYLGDMIGQSRIAKNPPLLQRTHQRKNFGSYFQF